MRQRPGSSGQSPEACRGALAGNCAVHWRAQYPTVPECPARRSSAPFLPLMRRAIGAGDGLASATLGAGGDEGVNEKLIRTANPLIPKAQDSIPPWAPLFPRPDPPGPGPLACRTTAPRGNGFLGTLLAWVTR